MTIFDIEYHSNLEIGRVVQSCNCADAFVEVIPTYERDDAPIPFAAFLYLGHNLTQTVDASGSNVDRWMTEKHGVAIYKLDVLPGIGDTHHDYKFVPIDDNFKKDIPFIVNKTAFVTVKVSRKESVIYDIPYNIKIDENQSASGAVTTGESGFLAALTNRVSDWPTLIPASSERFGVPKSLVLAVAVMETTHGWYDEPLEWVGANNSIRPMNINVAYWPDLFSEDEMYDRAKNFDAGAFMLKRIIERLEPNDRTVRKIATLYNNINAAAVTDYGARVEVFSRTLRPDWL